MVIFSLSEYADEATMIPKNTSVLIRRIPGRPRKPIVTEPEEYCLDLWLLEQLAIYLLIILSESLGVHHLQAVCNVVHYIWLFGWTMSLKMFRSFAGWWAYIEMCIQFCRSKAAEDGVEEVMPTASAFLGDSSMKYVRLTTSCWLSLYLAKVGHWKCIRIFIYLLEIAYIY